MNKVAMYCRVSTIDKQDYQRQISDLKPVISNHKFLESDIDEYSEKVSGYKKERPVLNKLLAKIEENPSYYKCIYVTEISRIGRNPKHTREIVDRLTELGVPLYIKSIGQSTIDENGKRNIIVSIILQVLMEFADLEAETFKERSRSGLRESAYSGKVGGGGNPPYGYTKGDEKKMIVDDEEAEIVKQIYQLYSENNGTKVIAGILNEIGVPTRYNKKEKGSTLTINNIEKDVELIQWSDKQVLDILTNTVYIGKRKFKDEIFESPRIIEDELFERCKEIRETKTHRNYLTNYTYLFKDIIKCGCCGKNYFAKYKPVPTGDKVYVCSSRLKKGGNCGNGGVNISLIESTIYNELINSDSILKYLQSPNNIKTELQSEIQKLEQQLKIETKNQTNKNNELNRLLDLFLSSTNSNMQLYQQREEKLNNEIKLLTDKVALIRKELLNKKITLKKFDEKKASYQMLKDAKHNRTELALIYKQIISRVVVNVIDVKNAFITVYIQLNGKELDNPLKIVLDLHGVKSKPKRFRYTPILSLSNEPKFNNGVLINLNKIGDEIIEKNEFMDWIHIHNKNVLMVEN